MVASVFADWQLANRFPGSSLEPKRSGDLAQKRTRCRSHSSGVYYSRIRTLNHCLGVYSYTPEPNGDLIFAVYDANQRDKLVPLRYQASEESFQFDKTLYYPGGLVTAMKLYVSPIMKI